MAQGASKVKRQEAEKQARELWTKLTMAEQARKVAEEHLMTGLRLSVSLCVCVCVCLCVRARVSLNSASGRPAKRAQGPVAGSKKARCRGCDGEGADRGIDQSL